MKRTLTLLAAALTISCQIRSNDVEQELTKLEKDFARAVVSNDADAVGKFLADDWVIIDPDGNLIEKARFLGVIKSGQLTHETMESEGTKVRSYGDSAVLTAVTKRRANLRDRNSRRESERQIFL
jgi:ketosteroid isomerase-like protein